MKKPKTWAGWLLALLVAAPPARGFEVRLRLSTGLDRPRLDNASLGVTGWADELRIRAATYPNLEFVGETVGNLKLGVGFEGEIQLAFSRHLALGLSAGYAYSSLPEDDVRLTIIWDGVTYNHTKPAKMSAYPVIASGYLMLPLGSKFSVYLRAGAGLTTAKYVGREGLKKADEAQFFYSLFETASARRPTYIGGLGFSYDFDSAFGFFVEATARSGKLTGFNGEDNLGQPGRLYFYEEYIPDINYWQAKVHVLTAPPNGPNFRSVREAAFDLGGYSARVGLSLRF
jgi:opacity protein-like surface antigen